MHRDHAREHERARDQRAADQSHDRVISCSFDVLKIGYAASSGTDSSASFARMPLLPGVLLASALAAAPTLPAGSPVVFRSPDVAAELRDFEPTPPAWSADVVNALYGDGMKAVEERQSGWLSSPARWELVDYVDRAFNYQTQGWLARRGIAAEHYGYNEFQETLALRPEGALEQLRRARSRARSVRRARDRSEHAAAARGASSPIRSSRAGPRCSATTRRRARCSATRSRRTTCAGRSGAWAPGAAGRFGDANARGFAAWRSATASPRFPICAATRARMRARCSRRFRPTRRCRASTGLARAPPRKRSATTRCSPTTRCSCSAANLQVFTRLYTDLRQHGHARRPRLRRARQPGRRNVRHERLRHGARRARRHAVGREREHGEPRPLPARSLERVELAAPGHGRGARARRASGAVPGQSGQSPHPRPARARARRGQRGRRGAALEPDLLARDAPGSVAVYDAHMRFRDAHRALFVPGGRTRLARRRTALLGRDRSLRPVHSGGEQHRHAVAERSLGRGPRARGAAHPVRRRGAAAPRARRRAPARARPVGLPAADRAVARAALRRGPRAAGALAARRRHLGGAGQAGPARRSTTARARATRWPSCAPRGRCGC